MLDGDARDFGECFGQRLTFVLVRREGFRHDRNFFDALGLQLGRGVNEPLHFNHLLVFAKRRRLKLTVYPFLGLWLTGPGGLSCNESRCCKGQRTVL